MGWFTRKVLYFVLWRMVRAAEQKGQDAFSDANAREMRRYIEDKLLALAARKQKGILDKTNVDDTALRYVQIVFKSRWLDDKINAFRGT